LLDSNVLSVITVTYNSRNEIESFVNSVKQQGVEIRLWLIDNASSDGTADIIMDIAKERKWISVKLNKTNIGLAAANNQPLAHLSSLYTAIINPDVIIHPGALKSLIVYLENNPDTVAVAPVNIDEDGVPHSSFHKRWSLFHLLIWRLLPAQITQKIYKAFRTYDEQDVLFASGSCIVMRTADLQYIGGYDPEYFLTVEDVCDLCIRLRKGNTFKRVVITPSAYITHFRSRSAAVVPFVTLWNGVRGSIYHFHKHRGLLAGIAAYGILLISLILRILFALPQSMLSARHRESINNNFKVISRMVCDNPLDIKNGVS